MLTLAELDGALCACDWGPMPRPHVMRALTAVAGTDIRQEVTPLLDEVRKQLDAYFAGSLRLFDVPLRLCGTQFQQSVWRALGEIPYACTVTYADVARAIGRPASVRAVATAIGANPLSIIVPCHRVIGTDGAMHGYAGGLPAKRFLLTLEQLGSS